MLPEPISLKPTPAHAMNPAGVTRPRHPGGPARFLTDVIVDLGLVPRDRVASAVEEGRRSGKLPEEVLIEQGALTSDGLSRAVAERHGLDHLDLGTFKPDMAAANLISIPAAKRYEAVPVDFLDDRTLLVAMADPANVLAVDDIALLTGKEIRPAVTSRDDILNLISRLSKLDDVMSGEVFEDEDEDGPADDRRPARVRRRRAGHPPRQPDHRPGRRAGRARTSTSSPTATSCACASASTASSSRPRRSSGAWCSASSAA